jgi:hypothetical protein
MNYISVYVYICQVHTWCAGLLGETIKVPDFSFSKPSFFEAMLH